MSEFAKLRNEYNDHIRKQGSERATVVQQRVDQAKKTVKRQ